MGGAFTMRYNGRGIHDEVQWEGHLKLLCAAVCRDGNHCSSPGPLLGTE